MKPALAKAAGHVVSKLPFDIERLTAKILEKSHKGEGGRRLLLRYYHKGRMDKPVKFFIPVTEIERALAASTLTEYLNNYLDLNKEKIVYPEEGTRSLPGSLAQFFEGVLVGCPDNISWVELNLTNYPTDTIGVRVVRGEKYQDGWVPAVHVTQHDIDECYNLGMNWVRSVLQKLDKGIA